MATSSDDAQGNGEIWAFSLGKQDHLAQRWSLLAAPQSWNNLGLPYCANWIKVPSAVTYGLVAQIAGVQTKTAVADSWTAAWNSHDVEKAVAIFTADVLYQEVTFGVANHGSAELRKFAASIFVAVPDARFELINSSADRRHGSIEWVFSGTEHGLYKTGKRFLVRSVSVIDLRGGRISRNLDYRDAACIMKQVGLLPPEKTNSTK